jgi:lauroyl/myristoyl acyltransferase
VSAPNARYGPLARGIRRDLSGKGWVPLRYWIMWWGALAVAMAAFYVVLTPIWLGLRAAAWVAELRARLRGDQAGSRR